MVASISVLMEVPMANTYLPYSRYIMLLLYIFHDNDCTIVVAE